MPAPPSSTATSTDVSANTSRPTSPAEEAEESLTPTEEDEYKKMAVAQCRRKSSVWKKTLNLKKQISKVNLKISSTIGEGVRRGSVFFGPTDGTTLSPVEMSPPDFPSAGGSATTTTDSERELMAQVEKDIVQNLSDVDLNRDATMIDRYDITPIEPQQQSDNSDDEMSSENERRLSSDTEWKKRIMNQPQYFQTRRSDASDEVAVRMLSTNQEGGRLTRPSDLPLFDENGRPVPTPRTKQQQQPRESRNQRLLSVPNIKYQRKESVGTKTDDPAASVVPATANQNSRNLDSSGNLPGKAQCRRDTIAKSKTRNAPTTSFAGNLMRRFSKY